MKSPEEKAREAAEEQRKKAVADAEKDPQVQAVLANAQLRSLLENPKVKAMLQQCQAEPGALRRYMADPEMRHYIMQLQAAGLVQVHPS